METDQTAACCQNSVDYPHKEERTFDWKAHWIWGGSEKLPRNEWRCFRREFELQEWEGSSAQVTITADARYVLYVNGIQCGRGPNRSWPFELDYHVHEVGHLLHAGSNTLAIIVISYGVATFSYVPGRGGLLAQLDSVVYGIEEQVKYRNNIISTDCSWQTAIHAGHEPRSPRMSCQLAFSEQMDGRLWNNEWLAAGFNKTNSSSDMLWENAIIIGEPGDSPWLNLKPSDIPDLTEQEVWPVRVESFKEVTPISRTCFLDIRQAMEPAGSDHANPVTFAGYAVTIIQSFEAGEATIGFVGFPALNGIALNGVFYPVTAMEGEKPQRFQRVQLNEGENLLLFELAGSDHGGGLHFGIDSLVKFELVSPLAAALTNSAFALIGPFVKRVHIDHKPEKDDTSLKSYRIFGGDQELDENAFVGADTFLRCRTMKAASELESAKAWLSPFPVELISEASVFVSSIWKRYSVAKPVSEELHRVCFSNQQCTQLPDCMESGYELMLDFGMEYSGFLRFEVDAPEGTVIDLYGLEYMDNERRQDTFGLDNTLRYICREGRQIYESPIRRGLRYLMVTVQGASRAVRLFRVQMLQSNYPLSEIGRFNSSDPLLNEIWKISKHTAKLCMEDTFVDCPAYEQAFWVGDSRNEALINYYLFGAKDIVKRCLQLVPGSSYQTPLYMDQLPSGWSSVIPNWTFFWVTACLEYVNYTGSKQFANDIWPKVRFTLDHYLQHVDSKGLLTIQAWNFLDWSPMEQPNEGTVTHQNVVFARTLADAASLAELAGEKAAGEVYRQASEGLSKAINQYLWSEERQAYVDCIYADGTYSCSFSMQTQVMALITNVAAGSRCEQLSSYMISPPEDFVAIGSPFMAFFYYEALTRIGRTDLVLEDIRKNFGEMIKYEATTCWELYPGFVENRPNPKDLTRSHCHAWSAAPGYFMGAYVLGIKPTKVGWDAVQIAPQPGNLDWAKGTVPMPGGGRMDVNWSIREENGQRIFRLEVTAPKGIEVELVVPEGYQAECIQSWL
ncbi:family 78 glycoside hydrolase catalytic domain [Paenibacillus barcinonensis]|uniref:family 78 glycoside hydrolase catalytic domain n=1 Tax=Paenibacillus barcinonensis TaxID=198119 RepID=UPI001C0FDEE0|nr:family 78 glycoside hydrolase catalytic domain [Paenibacillus barcinonensis]MBU5352185.1 family 78 glycoside hydrolase catalytic domain [Paenibacillus barcinonensis]